MGKTRGGKYGHKPRERVQRLGARGEGAEQEAGSDSEEEAPVWQRLGQSSVVGMLPPSDSESEGGEESQEVQKQEPKKQDGAQNRNVGKLPPTSDSDGSEESDSDSDGPVNDYLSAPRQPKKQAAPVERSAEDIRKEMERLQIVKKKREEDRLKRIAVEGWDRFQPMSDTNRPPGHVPSDHPSAKS